jgi:hypothetical protein
VIAELTHAVQLAQVATEIPNPGQGEAPPGFEGVVKILKWAVWLAFGACVLGAVITGAKMALGSHHGRGQEHGAALAWVFAGCLVIGSASALVGALV